MEQGRDTPDSPVVLVDALNVARSTWPNIEADRLISLCQVWARATGHRMFLVFDGRARRDHGDGPSVNANIAVIGTNRETADDWIEREAIRLANQGSSYWLVTSDRALRDRAGSEAERTIGGGTFARKLLALYRSDH